MVEIPDEIIIQMCRSNGRRDEGFTLLMNKYKERIYWHVRRIVVSHDNAEDVLQETFINVYRNILKFKGDSKIYTWLYRIATNEALRLLSNKRRMDASGEEISSKLVSTLREDPYVNGDDLSVRFQEAVLKLPQKQRLVFNLRYYDELPYEEISNILDSSVSSLKTNYHLASEKIKKAMLNGQI